MSLPHDCQEQRNRTTVPTRRCPSAFSPSSTSYIPGAVRTEFPDAFGQSFSDGCGFRLPKRQYSPCPRSFGSNGLASRRRPPNYSR